MISQKVWKDLGELTTRWSLGAIGEEEFYAKSMTLLRHLEKYNRNDSFFPEIRTPLLHVELVIQRMPFEFYDQSYAQFLKKIFDYHGRITKEKMTEFQKDFYPKSTFLERYHKHKNHKFYKKFAEIYESVCIEKYIEDVDVFSQALGMLIPWHVNYRKEHPSGERIEWIDSGFRFLKHKYEPPIYKSSGFCFAGLTSGGLEIVLPFSTRLDFSLRKADFNLGNIFPNSSLPEMKKRIIQYH